MNMKQVHILYNQAIIWHGTVPGFMKTCKDLREYERRIVSVIVSELKLT